MTTPENARASVQAKARLRAYVSHFIDHAQDHAVEIDALRPAVAGEARLQELLECASLDVQRARRSLSAVLEELGTKTASEHAGAHHAHPHVHHTHNGVHGSADVD
jgi:hypothetical protein